MSARGSFFRIAAIVSAILIAAIVAGCGESGGKGLTLGVAIPKEAQEVTLATVLQQPAGYNGKNVVFKGIISGQCASLCEFFIKDGIHSATIFPQGYAFPKLPAGKPVTVYALVTAGSEQVVFSALGISVGL